MFRFILVEAPAAGERKPTEKEQKIRLSHLTANKVALLLVITRITNPGEDLPQNQSSACSKIIYAMPFGVLSINRKLSNVKCYLKIR